MQSEYELRKAIFSKVQVKNHRELAKLLASKPLGYAAMEKLNEEEFDDFNNIKNKHDELYQAEPTKTPRNMKQFQPKQTQGKIKKLGDFTPTLNNPTFIKFIDHKDAKREKTAQEEYEKLLPHDQFMRISSSKIDSSHVISDSLIKNYILNKLEPVSQDITNELDRRYHDSDDHEYTSDRYKQLHALEQESEDHRVATLLSIAKLLFAGGVRLDDTISAHSIIPQITALTRDFEDKLNSMLLAHPNIKEIIEPPFANIKEDPNKAAAIPLYFSALLHQGNINETTKEDERFACKFLAKTKEADTEVCKQINQMKREWKHTNSPSINIARLVANNVLPLYASILSDNPCKNDNPYKNMRKGQCAYSKESMESRRV